MAGIPNVRDDMIDTLALYRHALDKARAMRHDWSDD